MECIELGISINFGTEISKTEFFPVSIIKKINLLRLRD